MKIEVNREDLLPVLQATNNVVERRHTLPILSNLLITAESDPIQLTATDMEVELICHLINSPVVGGSIAVPARKLFDICRALPADAKMTIESTESKVKVSSGRSR
ncbi:MAG: DNA polymerase III subunit beta, partial [Gammaproteobacteria bacterium]